MKRIILWAVSLIAALGVLSGCCSTAVGYVSDADLLAGEGIRAEVIKLNQVLPLEPELVLQSVRRTGTLLVAEEHAAQGSAGVRLAARLELAGVPARVVLLNCGEGFVPHGATGLLRRSLSLDGAGIASKVLEVLGRGKTAT